MQMLEKLRSFLRAMTCPTDENNRYVPDKVGVAAALLEALLHFQRYIEMNWHLSVHMLPLLEEFRDTSFPISDYFEVC